MARIDRRTILQGAGVAALGYVLGAGGYLIYHFSDKHPEGEHKDEKPVPKKKFGHQWLSAEEGLGVMPRHYEMLDSIVDHAAAAIRQGQQRFRDGKESTHFPDLDERIDTYRSTAALTAMRLARAKEKTLPEPTAPYEARAKEIENEAMRTIFFRTVDSVLDSRGYWPREKAPNSLHRSLDAKKLKCDTASALYLSVAQAVEAPVFGALTPIHMFVRWDPNGKHDYLLAGNPANAGDLNWDAQDGLSIDDSFHIQYRGWPWFSPMSKTALPKTDYMRNLTFDEAAALGFYAAGNEFESRFSVTNDKKDLEQGLKLLTEAITRLPKAYKFYYARADVWDALGDEKRKEEDFKRAEELIV